MRRRIGLRLQTLPGTALLRSTDIRFDLERVLILELASRFSDA